mmetsp:Transcript_10117/g.28601  ORF Transcript_10117/g.28601 Transcript_10117/m.28601 type:complete len:219 (+) Transcript_10117:93-749(+)
MHQEYLEPIVVPEDHLAHIAGVHARAILRPCHGHCPLHFGLQSRQLSAQHVRGALRNLLRSLTEVRHLISVDLRGVLALEVLQHAHASAAHPVAPNILAGALLIGLGKRWPCCQRLVKLSLIGIADVGDRAHHCVLKALERAVAHVSEDVPDFSAALLKTANSLGDFLRACTGSLLVCAGADAVKRLREAVGTLIRARGIAQLCAEGVQASMDTMLYL